MAPLSTMALLPVLFLASMVAAAPLPLNINLGAFSPALVVGDGAITFDGSSGVGTESIANALKSSSATATTTQAPVVASAASSSGGSDVKIIQANAADASILSAPASLPAPGSKELDPRV